MALELEGFRWRNDDGSETSATWMAAQDTNVNLPLDTVKRLRCIVNSITTAPATSKYRLEYKEAAEAVWSEVKASGGGKILMAASANVTASGEVTTAQLTAPSGKSSGADFVTGRMWDDESGLDDVALAAGKYTEDEFSIQAVSANGATLADVYSFRMVYLEGATPANYDNSAKGFDASASTTLSTGSFAIGGTNRVLYVWIGTSGSSPVIPSTVKWNGTESLTQIGTTLNVGATDGRMTLWRLINPTATTSTVAIVWGTAQDERLAIAVSYKDANQTTPNGTVASATGPETSLFPASTAGSAIGDLVADGVFFLDTNGQSELLTADGSQSSKQEIEGANTVFEGMGASTLIATSTSTPMSWTISGGVHLGASGGWGSLSFALKGL